MNVNLFFGCGNDGVEALLADRDVAEHLLDLRRVVDAGHDDVPLVARGGLDRRAACRPRGSCRRRRSWSPARRPGRAGRPWRRSPWSSRTCRSCPIVAGSTPVTSCSSPPTERLVVADMRGGLHAGHARERVALGGLERRPVLAVDDVRGADLVGHGRLDRGTQAGAEHRDDRHEREPDHQGGGGRRGPAGIARGVRSGQLAGHAARGSPASPRRASAASRGAEPPRPRPGTAR